MPYTKYSPLRTMLAGGALAIAVAAPSLAQAQFDVNKLYGKTFPEVVKMLGKENLVRTDGKPINYSKFKTKGSINTLVYYFPQTGKVGRVQIEIPAAPGETAADAEKVLKRYNLAIGKDPHEFPGVKPPGRSISSVGKVPGVPWTKVFISYLYAMDFKPETVAHIKKNKLDRNKTYFWTILLQNKKPARRSMASG
jgi:hypothetical protein